jgi:LacI family transcriptional regulator
MIGVSSTTVHRALTNKPKVNPDVRKRILETAKELGFKPNTLAQSIARKPMRIAVLFCTNFPEFYAPVIRGIKQTAEELRDYNVIVDYYYYDKNDYESKEGKKYFHNAMLKIARESYNGILTSGVDEKEFEPIEKLNIPLAFVVNDSNYKRRFCIRYNGFIAGMMAGELLSLRLGRKAKIALATGYDHVSIHHEIVRGFHEQIKITPLNLAAVVYNKDKEELAYTNTNKLLHDHPDIKGIYVNSYNSSGVIRSITEHGLAGKIFLITSDINTEIRHCLKNGAVSATIFQNQYMQGLMGLRYLYRSISENIPLEDTILINPELVFRSNMLLYNEKNSSGRKSRNESTCC